MSKKENPTDAKLCYNILQNKLRNLKEYDSRYGTKILESIGANIASIDDVLTKQLSGVSLSSCANNKYLANEVDTVTNIYSDLLTRIANNQSGCGANLADNENESESKSDMKELTKFKRDFITLIGKNAKRGRKRSKVASKRALAPSHHRTSSKRMMSNSSMFGEGRPPLSRNKFSDDSSIDTTMAARKRRSKAKKPSKKATKKSSKKMRSDNIFF